MTQEQLQEWKLDAKREAYEAWINGDIVLSVYEARLEAIDEIK